MKTTLTRESQTSLRLTIEASEEDLAPATSRAFKALAQQIKVPGFRKGHVPPKIIEARLGKEAVREAALREAIPQFYAMAVVEQEIEPIAPPKIDITSPDDATGLSFDATVEVRPEIKLPDYAGITVTQKAGGVEGDEIEEQLKRVQERFASLETVTRDAHAGDYILMNLRTYQHEKTIDEATGTDLLYELGSGGFVPELDAQVEAKRAGDIVKFNTTFPDGPGTFAGQEVSCEVLVKEVREKKLPALDDEFAKTASEFDTLDELRDDLRVKLTQIKKAGIDQEVRALVLESLVALADFEPPEALVEEEFAFRLQQFSQQLQVAGVGLDDYLTRSEQTEQKIEAELKEQAARNVRAQLLLEDIGKAEGLAATEEELADEVKRHAEALRTDAVELTKQLEAKGRLGALAGDIIRRKALDLVVAQADIRYEDPADAPAKTVEPGQSTTDRES